MVKFPVIIEKTVFLRSNYAESTRFRLTKNNIWAVERYLGEVKV